MRSGLVRAHSEVILGPDLVEDTHQGMFVEAWVDVSELAGSAAVSVLGIVDSMKAARDRLAGRMAPNDADAIGHRLDWEGLCSVHCDQCLQG